MPGRTPRSARGPRCIGCPARGLGGRRVGAQWGWGRGPETPHPWTRGRPPAGAGAAGRAKAALTASREGEGARMHLDPEGLDLILALPPTSQSQRPPSARPAMEHAGRRGGAEALRRGPGRCGAGRLALAAPVLPGRAGSGPAARSPPRPCLRRTETPRASRRCTWPPASDTRCWWSGCCERATQPRWRRWRGPCRCTTPPSAGT